MSRLFTAIRSPIVWTEQKNATTGQRLNRPSGAPDPGGQLRFDDFDGCRLTAFVTNTTGSQSGDLEVGRRWPARCEDRIRIAKDTGLANFPLKGFDQNGIWLAIVALAGDLQAWSGLLTYVGHEVRGWEPKRLRMHIYTLPATIARTARHAAWFI